MWFITESPISCCDDKTMKTNLQLTAKNVTFYFWPSNIPLIKSRRVAYRSCNFRRTRFIQPSISSLAWETVTSPDFSFHAMLSDAWLELVLENMTKFFFAQHRCLQSWSAAVSQLGSKRYEGDTYCTSHGTYPDLQITALLHVDMHVACTHSYGNFDFDTSFPETRNASFQVSRSFILK
jgi:hypothetical protein